MRDCEYTKCPETLSAKFKNGTIINWQSTATVYLIYLTDGSKIGFFINGNDDTASLEVRLDINGDKKPNIVGRDVFTLSFNENSTKSLNFTGVQQKANRATLKSNCATRGAFCGALIEHDSWQIKDDYPW